MPSQEEIDAREAEIKKNLGEKLGVEFCSPKDLEIEQKIAEAEQKVKQFKAKEKIKVEPPAVTVSEIITRCNEAGQLMSVNNPNRHLMWLCASALRQLVDRVHELEKKVN